MRKVRSDVSPPELQGIEISAGRSLVWGKNSSEGINLRVHYVLIKAGGKNCYWIRRLQLCTKQPLPY